MHFRNNYAFLSNFYHAPIMFGTYRFPTAENAYQAAKSMDPEEWYKLQLMRPDEAKRYGRTITLRPRWDLLKLGAMTRIVTLKFESHPQLMDQLIATGDIPIIEDNYWNDTYWGVSRGIGHNYLGRILMDIRSLNSVEQKLGLSQTES